MAQVFRTPEIQDSHDDLHAIEGCLDPIAVLPRPSSERRADDEVDVGSSDAFS